jgi:hypothetical protein
MPDHLVSATWMPWSGLAFGLIAAAANGVALFGKITTWQPAIAVPALACWALTTFLVPWLLLRPPRRTAKAVVAQAGQAVAQTLIEDAEVQRRSR